MEGMKRLVGLVQLAAKLGKVEQVHMHDPRFFTVEGVTGGGRFSLSLIIKEDKKCPTGS